MDKRITQLRVYPDPLGERWSWAIDYAGGGALGGHGFEDADRALADLLATLADQRRRGPADAVPGR